LENLDIFVMIAFMRPMYLPEVEQNPQPGGRQADAIQFLRQMQAPIPQILHLFAYKPKATRFLEQFTQQVMRGPSPLSPGTRELIAAYTSSQNHCLF
jgi:alkylhydroperoxidase family enzyme